MIKYGLGRIGEEQGGGWQYHLTDALGSVRQLADASGSITLAKGYEPYGERLGSAGSGGTMYGYAGEQTDASGLVYLRARFYGNAGLLGQCSRDWTSVTTILRTLQKKRCTDGAPDWKIQLRGP